MQEFELKGENGIIRIRMNEVFGFPERTSHFGGYECIVGIEIEVSKYSVNSNFHTTTGEIFKFYEKLKTCQSELNGIAEFDSYERNLDLTVKYDFGKVNIYGKFQEYLSTENILEFEFNSDQSYLKESVAQLKQITDKYGGMKGLNKEQK